MSYAVIKTGGKQYRVIEGQTLLVERLPDDVGATVDLQTLLLAGDRDPVFEAAGLASPAAAAAGGAQARLQAPDGPPPGADPHPHHVDLGELTQWHTRRASAPAATAATPTPSAS